MPCRRSKGLMVPEWCSARLVEAYIMRCVNCGALTDPTIERNQGSVPQEKRRVLALSSGGR